MTPIDPSPLIPADLAAAPMPSSATISAPLSVACAQVAPEPSVLPADSALDASLPAAEDPFVGPLSEADHFTAWLDKIADALVGPGYLVLDGLLPESLVRGLSEALVQDLVHELRPAGIGRGDDYQLNRQVRRDKIRWLDEIADEKRHPAVTEFLLWMDRLRAGLNQRLFLGLFEYECHFAIYEPGDFYQKHLDAFRGNPGRKLSTVFYLNSDWQPDDAGELVLYDEAGQQELERVAPKGGRLAIFLSEDFPHEVLPAGRCRASIAGWFRVNPLG